MSKIDTNVLKDGQLAVATAPQSGTIISDASAVDATALVQTDNGPQLCVKTVEVGEGGGGGGTVDQTYDPTSTNAQSGTAVAEAVAPALQNTATGTDALTILGTATNSASSVNIGQGSIVRNIYSVAIGNNASAGDRNSVVVGSSAESTYGYQGCIAVGNYAKVKADYAIVIGRAASATATRAIQLGHNTDGSTSENNVANTLQVFQYQLLDGNTGYIPADRINMLTRAWNLSSSNYLEGKTTFDFESAPTMEFFLHFTTNSYFSDNFMFSLIDYESTGGGFDIATKQTGKLWISQANVGTTGWAYDGSLGDLSANTEYWFKMTFDGSVYTYLLSTDENFTNPTTSTYPSSVKIKNSTAKPRFGSVIRSGVGSSGSQYTNYISDCYLKLGNTKVFDGKKGSQYNIIGSPSLLTTLN